MDSPNSTPAFDDAAIAAVIERTAQQLRMLAGRHHIAADTTAGRALQCDADKFE
jgi:hypothetical protein